MQERKNEGLIKDSYELIIKELQTVITIFYLLLVGIGMVFNYYKYSEYGINIFQYADVFDFLIAPFQDITIVIFAVVSTIIPFLFYKFDVTLQKTNPKQYSKYNLGMDKYSWFNPARNVMYITLLIYYIFLAGSIYGDRFKKGINSEQSLSLTFADNEVVTGILIGKTKEIVFLLQEEDVLVIPIGESVKKILINQNGLGDQDIKPFRVPSDQHE